MTVTAQISAAYEPLVDEFKAVADAARANAEAQAAASASPGNAALQAAAAATAAALADAEAALDAVDDALMALLDASGIELDGANVVITNAAPDEGLSAPFNSWFTLFGQFFDHGLDLVAKGGNGTVFIPLMPDDPLYVPGGTTNFMVLTRATLAGPGADGILGDDPATVGINEGADDTDRPVNTTTSFVDQNQTYTSHPSHQVFLREYELNAAGDPVATGKLIEGSNGGMATWADLKAQAATFSASSCSTPMSAISRCLRRTSMATSFRTPTGFPQFVTIDRPQSKAIRHANGGLGVLIDDPALTFRPIRSLPDRSRLPCRHRSQRGAGPDLPMAISTIGLGNPDNRPSEPGATTTNCSTRTLSPATVAPTRISASPPSITSSIPSTTGSSSTPRRSSCKMPRQCSPAARRRQRPWPS